MPSIVFNLCVFGLLIMFDCCLGQQQQEQLIVRTTEKLPVHSEVVNLRRLLLSKNLSDSNSADFTLAKRDEFPYMFFLINHSSRGILTIRKEIDRDELCRLRRCRCDTWCDLELEIFVNNEQFNIELITIRILDLNDHSPQFSTVNNPLNLTIVESAQVGAMIKLEPAIDYDQGQNGIIGYSLLSTTVLPFSLRYDVTRGDLALVVDQSLDRELISSYAFDIVASDGGNQTGVLHVHLTIDDVNDSPPKFDQLIYTIQNISENLPLGSVLLRVHATDPDEGVNGEITYHLIKQDDCFQIDHITGDVRATCVLDYETKTKHRLEIEARDGGEGSKTDLCTLIIFLVDENDNYPFIDFYPTDVQNDSKSLQLSLSEALPINSLILSLSITDADSGDNGRVTWRLDRSTMLPFELIRLTEMTGELRTKRLLDREYISEYNFKLEAHDHGKPTPKSTHLNIHVNVLDENDNAPKFRQDDIRVPISEHVTINHPNGYDIYQIQADDFDQGRNGEVNYAILNDRKKLFEIDAQTGVIRAMVEFDRKQQHTYVLNIQATDKGIPPLSSNATVTFTIVPRNEHPPVCNVGKNSASLFLMENSKPGTVVTTLACHDDDKEADNGQMSVQARWWTAEKEENQTKASIPFDIATRNNASGSLFEVMIIVNGSIDRESIPSYQLLLTISDNGNPPQSTNVSFSIDILDDNDHCPQLHIETSFIMINRDISQQDFAMHLIASDDDQGVNGQIKFELSSLTASPFVRLYSNGTLFVQTNSSSIQDDQLVVLHVQISDQGQPTPCLIVETLRLFIGSNRTDWTAVLKYNDQTSSSSVAEQFQQGKRMAYGSAIQSTPKSFYLFDPSSSLSSFASRKQLFAALIGSTILLMIVIISLSVCLVDRFRKKTSKKKPLIKSNGLSSCPYNIANGKRIASSSPLKTRFCYEDDSPTHHYSNSRSTKPIVVVGGSSSHSSSSVESTARTHTARNRSFNRIYSYTAIGTSDELTPVDFDDEYNDGINSGVELMMTTV